VVIVPLKHSVRCDIVAALPGLPERRLQPQHFATMELAEAFAREIQRIAGFRIVRPGDPQE
jgi:hypothetical protein